VRTTTVDRNRYEVLSCGAARTWTARAGEEHVTGLRRGALLLPPEASEAAGSTVEAQKRLTLLEVPSLGVQRFSLILRQGADQGGGNCGLISLSASKHRTWVQAEKRGGGGRPLADFTGNRRELFEVPLDTYLVGAGRETGIQRIPGVTRRAEATAEREMSGTDNNL
jgi:hypothetical protein